MDVVLYLRFSSDKQTEQSIEGQDRVCRAFCESQGYNIIDTYIDRALSASHDVEKRVDFQRMIKDSEKRSFEGVVVYKLDRFARNRYDSATYKAKLKKNGVRVISATEDIKDNPEGILLESVLEGMAEFYSKELSQKVTRGMYETAIKGNSNGGHIPLGYKVENKKLIIDTDTAPAVKKAFEFYASGATIKEICRILNDEGYRASKGKPFSANSFSRILKNEKYIGVYKYGDVRIEGGVPAIISKDIFDKVQERIKDNERAPARAKAQIDYLLSGKVFCGKCGRAMNGDSGTGRNGDKYYYYTCDGKKRLHTCDKKSVGKDLLEETVINYVVKLLTPEVITNLAEIVVEEERKNAETGTLLVSLEKRLSEIDLSISRLLTLVESGAISHSLTERLNTLEREKDEVIIQLSKERHRISPISEKTVSYWFQTLKNNYKNDPDSKRSLIDALVNSIYVYDTPTKPYIDIVLNYNPKETKKITLNDFSGAPTVSDLNRNGAPTKKHPIFRVLFCCCSVQGSELESQKRSYSLFFYFSRLSISASPKFSISAMEHQQKSIRFFGCFFAAVPFKEANLKDEKEAIHFYSVLLGFLFWHHASLSVPCFHFGAL